MWDRLSKPWPVSPVPKLHLGCAFQSNSSHPLDGGCWLHMGLPCIFLQFHRRWVEMVSKKSFTHGDNLPEADSNLLENLGFYTRRTPHLGTHTYFTPFMGAKGMSCRGVRWVCCALLCGLQIEFLNDILIKSSCRQTLFAFAFGTVCTNNERLILKVTYI